MPSVRRRYQKILSWPRHNFNFPHFLCSDAKRFVTRNIKHPHHTSIALLMICDGASYWNRYGGGPTADKVLLKYKMTSLVAFVRFLNRFQCIGESKNGTLFRNNLSLIIPTKVPNNTRLLIGSSLVLFLASLDESTWILQEIGSSGLPVSTVVFDYEQFEKCKVYVSELLSLFQQVELENDVPKSLDPRYRSFQEWMLVVANLPNNISSGHSRPWSEIWNTPQSVFETAHAHCFVLPWIQYFSRLHFPW